MKALGVVEAKRQQLARLANQRGAAGEVSVLGAGHPWLPRPSGQELKILMSAVAASGVKVKASRFDAISCREVETIDFGDLSQVSAALPQMEFIEIKSTHNATVKADFSGFFFALTEGQIVAFEALGPKYKVALYNDLTKAILLTTVPEVLARARSKSWQVSVQL